MSSEQLTLEHVLCCHCIIERTYWVKTCFLAFSNMVLVYSQSTVVTGGVTFTLLNPIASGAFSPAFHMM